MDPLSQGTLGAALPQSFARPEHIGLAMLCGVLGGMAPDLDVLIRSSEDPLLFLEYHRQFTHSLFFIPIGAGLVAILIWALLGYRRRWRLGQIYAFTLLGYATHALLDACTTYGTQLLWPFSHARFAWNTVSIIDPLFTLPLLVLVVLSRWWRQPRLAMLGMAWGIGYLLLGLLMHNKAVEAGEQMAIARGHRAVVEAKPSFANIILWKTVYRHNDRYYVDAVRVLGTPVTYEGESIEALDVSRDFPWLTESSVQARDVERFRWFSNGYLAADPNHPNRIMDLRYSMLPNEIRPLWSIELNPSQQDQHVQYLTHRDTSETTSAMLWRMIKGESL